MHPKLKLISDALDNGEVPSPITVRRFLKWFNAQRRGYNVVSRIRRLLAEANLQTFPDFDHVWIDGVVSFQRPDPLEDDNGEAIEDAEFEADVSESGGRPTAAPDFEEAPNWISRDATHSIGKLGAANAQVVCVGPDASLAEAVTQLLIGDFSQLPVMTNERDVRGTISWKSIGSRLALSQPGNTVRHFMDMHHEVRYGSSIFDAIPLIVAHGCVLVRKKDNTISGIVTVSDLSLQFRALTEPFLLISEIETFLRNLIGEGFNLTQLRGACDPTSAREISSVADLTFGEYLRLLENPDHWSILSIPIDRATFCRQLNTVREIRNDVTHFDPDGVASEDLTTLRNFTSLLKTLESLRQS